jgi:hypothetical protein
MIRVEMGSGWCTLPRLWFLTGVVMSEYSGVTWCDILLGWSACCVCILLGLGSAGPGYMIKYPFLNEPCAWEAVH